MQPTLQPQTPSSLSQDTDSLQKPTTFAGALLFVDLSAIQKNYQCLRAQMNPDGDCGATVKANAYGLGLQPVAIALYEVGCRTFYVAHLEEGLQLRAHFSAYFKTQNARSLDNPALQIVVMHGIPKGFELLAFDNRLTPVLNSWAQIQNWKEFCQQAGMTLPAYLQVDTGMSRMGLPQDEWQTLVHTPHWHHGLQIDTLMSHLACADETHHAMNQTQLVRFQNALTQMRECFPQVRASLANSSGIFLGKAFHFDRVRPGAALYGVAPISGQPNPMQNVVSLKARIIQTRHIAKGDGVGYSQTWIAQQDSVLATLAIGYADGWLRSISNRGIVQCQHWDLPIVGRISMDTLCVDITQAYQAEPQHFGDNQWVDIVSARHTINEVAQEAHTIGYEILTSLGSRFQRHYL